MIDSLSVREMEHADVPLIVDYWMGADHAFLQGMGVDVSKVPTREQMTSMIAEQLSQPYEQKKAYSTVWLINDQPAGHCNVNKIIFGQEAYMHLHLWNSSNRQKGTGAALVKLSVPLFFKNLQLQTLYCEPYALNPAPNKTVEKVGFEFVKNHITFPGAFNFEQPANLWQLTYEKSKELF